MEILIVGGGVIGRSTAWQLSCSGARVTLVDRPSSKAASKVAAGLLIPAGGRISPHHYALRRRSAELYPNFVKSLEEAAGQSVGYRRCGTLTVAYEPGAEKATAGMCNCLRGIGVELEQLSREECLAKEPALGPLVGSGYLTADHLVDPLALLAALRKAGELSGVCSIEGEVEDLQADGVRLKDGTVLKADRVMVATGAWLGKLLQLPVYPVKGETLQLSGPTTLLNHCLSVQRQSLYVASRGDGRFVVGATEEEVGFEDSVTATQSLWQRATSLVPALKAFCPSETRVGFRPKVGDGLPVLGEYQGVFVAGGHYRNGILLAPVTAQLMSRLLLHGEVSDLMKPFAPGRDMNPRHRRKTNGERPVR